MIKELQQLCQPVYESNKQRGFWEKGQDEDKDERVMLIITELSEAVEAHRKGKVYLPINVNLDYVDDSLWCDAFVDNVKDTVDDEIADAVIRILDYCGGFNIPIIERECRKQLKPNFAANILTITKLVTRAGNTDYNHHHDWGYVLAAIIKLCDHYQINLKQHILWKLMYNRTRSYKHGKRY